MNEQQSPKRTVKEESHRNHRAFGLGLFLITLLIFSLFIVRFGYIAIFKDVKNHNLKAAAQRMYTNTQIITAKRGAIFDANGNAIAQDTSKYTVVAVLSHTMKEPDGKPLYVKDKEHTAQVLAKYLKVKPKQIKKTLNTKGAFQVQFGPAGSNLSVATMEKIKAEKLPGISFIKTPAREYPEGQFASQLVGLAVPKASHGTTKLVGQLGLEATKNKLLSGKNGLKKSINDVYGTQMADSTSQGRPVQNGANITTTLDNSLQHDLETLVGKVYGSAKPAGLTAVIMEAKTGKILAATQRPNYKSDAPAWTNALVQDTYEPGSTMKMLTLAAAIDSGHFNPNATYNSGVWNIGGGRVTDWVTSGWGSISYKEAFYRSSNVGFAHIEQNMGSSTWMTYLKRFGMLKKVGVYGMGGEQAGYTNFKGTLEQTNTAFGQGITVNVMEMMQAFSAIANHGKMVKPYWIQKVVDPKSGKVLKRVKPQTVGHPIKASTAKQVLKYMQGVIYNKVGTGSAYKVDGYRIAGKTGTAQIGGASGYETGSTAYIYSFAGFAPAKDPKYIIYVTMKKPTKVNGSAEQTIASITTPLIKDLLEKEKLKTAKEQGLVKLPNLVGMTTAAAQKGMTNKGLIPVVLGSGEKVQAQSLAAGNQVTLHNRVFLLTGGPVKMPDLTGWSQADVSRLAQVLGLKLESSGGGFVNKQNLKKDSVVKPGQTLRVTYQDRGSVTAKK